MMEKMPAGQRSLQLDMDLLEPFKLRVKVVVLGSDQGESDYVDNLNQKYGTITLSGRTTLVRFYKERVAFPSLYFEWHRSIVSLLFIYDSSLVNAPLPPAEVAKQYEDLKQRDYINVEVRKLLLLTDFPIDMSTLKQVDKGEVQTKQISRDIPCVVKVHAMKDVIEDLMTKSLGKVVENFAVKSDPEKVHWRLTEEADMDQQDLFKKRKGRHDKWILDLNMMSQNWEESLKTVDEVRAECKRQYDYIWVASADTAKAASILMSRYVKGEPLLKSPVETDEAIVTAEKALKRYGKYGKPEFEMEVAFKLVNTYKAAKRYLEMFAAITRISEQLVPKWTGTEYLVPIYLTMARICESVGAHRKSAYYIYLSGRVHKDQRRDEAKLVHLLEILDAFGIARDPSQIVSSNYAEAEEAMRIVAERNYKFSYKSSQASVTGSKGPVLTMRRLPPGCAVFLKEKHPIIRCNLEDAPWPKLQMRVLSEVLEFDPKKLGAGKCNLSLQMYVRFRRAYYR